MQIPVRTTCLLLFTVCSSIKLSFAAEPTKPNILFIVGDDMGYADVGFQGCKDIPTPNLDSLAKSGVQFTNGYVTGPYCSPTRAAMLTGRYQNRFGHEYNPGGSQGLPLAEKTVADRLKAAGYSTGLVGKWHLGSEEGMHPQQRGFDDFFGFLGGAHSYFKSDGILRGTTPVKELDKRGQPVTAAKLYNLAKDIGETKDLAAEMPDKVKELQAKWDAWNTKNVPPAWGSDGKDNDGPEPGAKKNLRQQNK